MLASTRDLEIDFYTRYSCGQCMVMKRKLNEWIEHVPERLKGHVDVRIHQLEDMSDDERMALAKERGALSSPVVIVKHLKKYSGPVTHVTSGLQPDRLIDMLDDDVVAWDDPDDL